MNVDELVDELDGRDGTLEVVVQTLENDRIYTIKTVRFDTVTLDGPTLFLEASED